MKKILVLVGIVAVFSTGLSFAMSRWLAGRRPSQSTVNIHDAAWLKRELNLTDTQASEIGKLEGEFQVKLSAACTEHCAARFALGDELMKSKPDLEKARADVERMNRVQAESERATLDHILKVRALLTDEQARQYSAMIHDQVCSMPMGTP
jgi:Spy/CpxP family protein refolding chaperone